jgi:hypothetical protein
MFTESKDSVRALVPQNMSLFLTPLSIFFSFSLTYASMPGGDPHLRQRQYLEYEAFRNII